MKKTNFSFELEPTGGVVVLINGEHSLLSTMLLEVMAVRPDIVPIILGAVIEWAKRTNVNLCDLAQANANIIKN